MQWSLRLKPRSYQTEATDWALVRNRAVCCLPTGAGKTMVGLLWLKQLFESGKIHRALILEPTRLLVNQTTEYFLDKAGVECVPIDGRIPRERRCELWASAELVVATPETAFNDIEDVRADAVVVDECHHTCGQDAFAKVMGALRPKYRLGLSAFVPLRREQEVGEFIGPIKRWSWRAPDIAPYVPNWIGEVFEGRLNAQEQSLLMTIRGLRGAGLLERYLTRDGSMAVRETLTKNNYLTEKFAEMLLPAAPDTIHKLQAVSEIFDSHEPHKAIVFVDRVIIADKVAEFFPQMRPVVFKGKRGAFDQGMALQQAKDEQTRLVVSTSAGEEGIDLPSADLLVIWGNAASDIRFIQRLGRMMRKVGEGLKFATFVVTPESADFDSFAEGLTRAALAGTVDVEKTFGWDPEVLWPKTTWWHVSESLRGNPTPLPMLEERLKVRGSLADKVIGHATKRGRVFYLYDVAQLATDVVRRYLEWDADRPELAAVQEDMRSLSRAFQNIPDPAGLARNFARLLTTWGEGPLDFLQVLWRTRRLNKFPVKAPTEPEEQVKTRRLYLLIEDACRAGDLLPQQLSTEKVSDNFTGTVVTPIQRGPHGGLTKGLRQILRGLPIWGSTVDNPAEFWERQMSRQWAPGFMGYQIGYRSIALDFHFYPASAYVFAASYANMNCLLLYRDIFEVALNTCSRCGGRGAALSRYGSEMLCLSCWSRGSAVESPPAALARFGFPVL